MFLTDEIPTELADAAAKEFGVAMVSTDSLFRGTIASENLTVGIHVSSWDVLKECLGKIEVGKAALFVINGKTDASHRVTWGDLEEEVYIVMRTGQGLFLMSPNKALNDYVSDYKPIGYLYLQIHRGLRFIDQRQDSPEFARLLRCNPSEIGKVFLSIREEIMSGYKEKYKKLLIYLAASLPVLVNTDVKKWICKRNTRDGKIILPPFKLESLETPIWGINTIGELSDLLPPTCLKTFVSTRVEELVNAGLVRHKRKLVDIKNFNLLKQLKKGSVLLTQCREEKGTYYVAYEYVGNAPYSFDGMYIQYRVDLVRGSIDSNNKRSTSYDNYSPEKGVILLSMDEFQSIFRDALLAARNYDLKAIEILLKALGYRGQYIGERYFSQEDQEIINQVVEPLIGNIVEESGLIPFYSEGNLKEYLWELGVNGEEVVLLKGNEGIYFAIRSKEESEDGYVTDYSVYLIDFNLGDIRLLESEEIENVIELQKTYKCVIVPNFQKLEDIFKVPFEEARKALNK